ncbi:MAG: hypothetical protein GW855_07195 [Erythrobacter sp.]|nr:hypothetical protein [Erythrobacter sp.]NCQ64697.1 hypothetical protein [Alphaproteobacteria bacterium]
MTRGGFAKLALCAASVMLGTGQSPPATDPDQPTPPPAATDLASPSPAQIDRVMLDEDGSDRFTVPVRIGTNGPYPFLIDTGAQATIVSERLAAKLAIPSSGSAVIVSTASTRQVPTIRLPDLAFANRTIPPLDAPMLQFHHLGVDGILGLDALQDLRVLIDFRDGHMDVVDARDKKPDGRFDIIVRARAIKGHMIIADARIDGIRTAVIIDTGAQISVGNFALRDRMRSRDLGEVAGIDVLGTDYSGRVSFARRVDLGRLQMGNLPIAFVESPAFAQLGYSDTPALLLGVGSMRQLDRVAIDFVRRSVLFDIPDDVMRRALPASLDRRRTYATAP